MTDPFDALTPEQQRAEILAGRMEALAQRLLQAAALASACAADVRAGYPESRRSTPYADAAGAVFHEINISLMNATVGGIVSAAAEAEIARSAGGTR